MSRITHLADVKRIVSCVLLQNEELVPYPAAFVPVQGLPGVRIRAQGLLPIPRAGTQPPTAATSPPQDKQEHQESQGSAYAWTTPTHRLGSPPKCSEARTGAKIKKNWNVKTLGLLSEQSGLCVSQESSSNWTLKRAHGLKMTQILHFAAQLPLSPLSEKGSGIIRAALDPESWLRGAPGTWLGVWTLTLCNWHLSEQKRRERQRQRREKRGVSAELPLWPQSLLIARNGPADAMIMAFFQQS